jgi:drug/metabolite transporter (DMT)-like permease
MKSSSKANLYLILITAIWGGTFPFIRDAVAHLDPYIFVFVRFILGAILIIPIAWNELKKSSYSLIKMGIILGVLNSAAFISQTIALQMISSSRTAFITGFYVIVIPLLSPLFKLGRPRSIDIICAAICLCGLYILTGENLGSITRGDEWALLGAILFGIAITYLQYSSLRTSDYKALAFYQIFFTAPLPLLFTVHAQWENLFLPSAIAGILFCAVAGTSIALYLQTKYQQHTTAAKAAIIYSLEPVFACVFAFMMNGEAITKNVVEGGFLIFLSLILPALILMWKKKETRMLVEAE